ncbi:unnamed protein product [Fusarium langsethiae]|nr:unnamed protein product [Fusarium langsethiae]
MVLGAGVVQMLFPYPASHPPSLGANVSASWENLSGCRSSYGKRTACAKRSNAYEKRNNDDVKLPKGAPSRNNTNEKKSDGDAKKPKNAQTHRDH